MDGGIDATCNHRVAGTMQFVDHPLKCGCRWFDRINNTCYECAAEVTPENLAELKLALEEFNIRRQAR